VTDKAKMSPQKIADGFMYAMYKNRLHVHLLHDLQANKAAMLSITARLGNAAEAVPRAELADLDRQLTDLNDQIEELMVSLYRVQRESPVATAARTGTDKTLLIKELQDTYARFQDVMAKRLRAGESVNMELFDEVIKRAEADVASSRAEYDEWFKAAGKKRKERGDVLKGVLAQARIHERAIAESAKFSEKAGGQVGQVAYRQALENAANRLDATLAGTNDSLDMAGRAMLRTVHDGWHVYAKSYNTPLRAVKRVQAFVRDFTHPLRDKLQTDDEKIASIAADMMGYSRNGLYEAAQVARAGETAGERLDNSLRFVTDADATDIGGVKVSHNASGNAAKIESLWDRGSRTLGALAQKSGKEDAVALEALARAFMFESGKARTRTPTPAMAARVLKKAKNIDEFIEGLRILPESGGGIRRETVVQNGVERLETYAEAIARLEKEVEAGNMSKGALKKAIAQEGKAVNIVTQAIVHGDTVAGTAERINAEVVAMKLADMGVDFERAGELLGTLLTPKDSKNANFEDALAVAEALGMRWDQLQTMDAVSKKVRNLGFLAMEGGTLPLTVFSELEKDLGRLVKSTDLFKTEETNRLLAGFLWGYDAFANMFRTSLLTGLWGFNPGYYTSAFFGALGQAVTMEGYGPASKTGARALGLDKAVRLAKRSFEQYRPALFMGKEAADAAEATRQGMAAASGLPTSKVLPNATASLAEPHITAFYDRVTYPDAEEVIEGMTWGQLRKEARKRGVLASGINAIGVRDAILKGRTWIDETPILRRWKQWQTWKADLADAVDQRQRVALFMENVLHRKMDFDEAADSVKGAYYDWNYPTNGFEREFLSRILMFWTFQRKALEQGGRVIASTFDPTKQQITGFAPGASAMARLKDQAKVVKAASFYGQRYGDEDLTEEEKELRRVFPGWATGAGSRNFLFNLEEDQEFRQAYLEGTGRRITHQSYTMPSSVGDFVDVYLGMLPAVMGGFRRGGLSGAAGGAAMYTGDEIVAMGNMYTEDAFSKVWEGAMGKGAKAQPGRTYTNPADDALLRSLGYFGAHLGLSVNEDKDKRGFVRLSPVGNLVYQAMPWFSVELKRTYQPFFEASLQPTWSRAATTWTRQYGGLLRGYYFDAPGVIEWDSKTIGEDLAAALREDERTAPVGTTPAAELAEREQAKYDKYRGGGSKKKKKKKTTAW
jgi:hypothetical protein